MAAAACPINGEQRMAQNWVAKVEHWCFDVALPFWAGRALDPVQGGVQETLNLMGEPLGGGFQRARVACRQLYVFSHAELLGWTGARPIADGCLQALMQRFWRGPDKGFARRVRADGGPLDDTPDLYDHAFVLFALAWRARATADAAVHAHMHKTLDVIETILAHPSGEGFAHEAPMSAPRQQNPHMHLLEAALAAFETTGEARFQALSAHLVELFQRRFFDRASGTLAEFYTDNWSRAPGAAGRLVEPGHQFEWAWILAKAQALFGWPLGEDIKALVAFAEANGVDRSTGLTFNSVRDDGAPLDRGSRTWPNTERIKGWLALAETQGVDARAPVGQSCAVLFERYLAPAPPGCWMDAYDDAGKPQATTVPASTLYHIFLAFAEILRLRALLT
jgi:mannose/cellobiose epimerase-like protein (N-acyl-D-glucosamine 2-epimerase family)